MKIENIENILEVEGVNSKGFGIVSQAAMFDRDVPCPSKGIYAYLVSYTGAGRTIYPKRETILADLKMSKNAFYKYFKPLVDNGYISVSKAKGFKNKNVYTICNNPKKINTCVITEADKFAEGMLQLDGINAKGYGFIPKLIMCDNRLSIKAKSLIAFFYSIVQSGCTAFPHRSTICAFLNISKDVYYKALNQLINCNYISVKQRHTSNGKFTVNDYTLIANPTAPCLKNEDNPNNGDIPNLLPCLENEDIIKTGFNAELLPCPKNKDITNANRVRKNETLPCLKNEDNNNSTSINSDSYISSSNLNVSYIPYTQNKDEITKLINNLTRIDDYSCSNADFCRKYCSTVKILIEILCVPDHAIYAKKFVKTIDLFNYLNDCITDDTDGVSLRDLIMQTVWHYEIADSKYNIKRPREYLKALLFDEIYNFDL